MPFAGILLSIALLPLLAPRFWHHHFGKVAAAWALAFLRAVRAACSGPASPARSLVHALLAEYIPFVILLTALFTVAGGIYIRGNLHGSPALNTAILAIGAVLASFMGTTGASMLLIRPLIRANDNRRHKAHVVVFFIFIVSNAGGSLTPLGDPPLFLGFLKGVDFFWTVQPHLARRRCSWSARCWRSSTRWTAGTTTGARTCCRSTRRPTRARIGFDGARNFWLLGAVVGLVLLSGFWKSPVVLRRRWAPQVGLPGPGARHRAWSRSRCCRCKITPRHGARGQPVLLGPDAGGGQAVRRHLPDHHPGDRHAARRRRRPVRRRGRAP